MDMMSTKVMKRMAKLQTIVARSTVLMVKRLGKTAQQSKKRKRMKSQSQRAK